MHTVAKRNNYESDLITYWQSKSVQDKRPLAALEAIRKEILQNPNKNQFIPHQNDMPKPELILCSENVQ